MDDARENKLANASGLGGLDHRHAHVRLPGCKRWVDVEDAVDALCGGAQAVGFSKVSDYRLISTNLVRDARPARVAHERPYRDTTLF